MNVVIDWQDYVVRIFLILLGGVLAYYVNRVYSNRLREIEQQSQMQKLVSQQSASFLRVNHKNLNNKMTGLLKRLGLHFDVDRCYVFLLSEDQKTMHYSYEWCADGIEPAINLVQTLPASDFPWWLNKLRHQQRVYVPNVSSLPPEASQEKEILTRQGILSTLALPIMSDGVLYGFMGFDSVRQYKRWQTNHQQALMITANLVSDALVKVNNENQISHMAYYDNLTNLPNRTLFNHHLEAAIAQANQSGQYVGLLFLYLDSFKAVNDTMGHDEGDQLLIKIADQLSQHVRQRDYVCRFGVENDEQIKFLIHYGCHEIQGYYFYKPLPAKKMEALLFLEKKIKTQSKKTTQLLPAKLEHK